MLNKEQIKLVQTAARAAGLRDGQQDGRYRLLLRNYRQYNGCQVNTCKQLNNRQLDDFLAICESMGWRHPDHSETHFRDRAAAADEDSVSYAQIQAIDYLCGDMGWTKIHLGNFINKMTKDRTGEPFCLSNREAYNLIEALKAILCRKDGAEYKSLGDITEQYRDVKNGREVENTLKV